MASYRAAGLRARARARGSVASAQPQERARRAVVAPNAFETLISSDAITRGKLFPLAYEALTDLTGFRGCALSY